MKLNHIDLYKRGKMFASLDSPEFLLEYFKNDPKNFNGFIKINDSLILYINENHQAYIKKGKLSKTDFWRLIQQYQKCGTIRKSLYWTRRGYTELEAKEKVSEVQTISANKIDNSKIPKPNQIKYWTERGYTASEAKEKVSEAQRKRSRRCSEYWENHGYTELEAKEKVSEYQKELSARVDHSKIFRPNQVRYWIKKGYTELEAKEKVSERQTTFSKEIIIGKYGLEEGTKKLEEVAKKKEQTFHNRPQEEQDKINIARGKNSIGYWSNSKFFRVNRGNRFLEDVHSRSCDFTSCYIWSHRCCYTFHRCFF